MRVWYMDSIENVGCRFWICWVNKLEYQVWSYSTGVDCGAGFLKYLDFLAKQEVL
jgi:hypothetical protein